MYWINFYDTYKNGYNETLGGDGGPNLPGEKNPNSKLVEKDIYIIREAVLKCEPQKKFFIDNFKDKISYS